MLFLLGASLELTCLHALPERAQSPPPTELARLDARLLRTTIVRITRPSGWLLAERARASVDGLAYLQVLATSRGRAWPAPGCIPWSETARVERPGNHALDSALVAGPTVGGRAGAGPSSAGPPRP